jgi:hypothetical protein
VNLRRAVVRVLRTFGRRLSLVEDSAERSARAAEQSALAAARTEATAERIERAVAELGSTVNDDLLKAMADERSRRAGLGTEVMRLSSRVDSLERHGGPNGAA